MTSPFPIPDFVQVNGDELTQALNALILDFNAVIIQSGGGAGATGYVTRRQLFEALNSQGVLTTVNSAVIALAVTNPVWIEYNTSQTISQTGNLASFIASTLSYSTSQMNALWALAAQQIP